MISAGIIGCGKIAGYFDKGLNPNTHAGAYYIHKNFKLVVSYDIVEKKSIEFAKKYNCNSSKDLNEFLDEYRPEIISVTTPDKTHYKIVKMILLNSTKPKVILLEKPACETKEEFEELVRLSTSNKVPIVVNLSRRFDDYHNHIKNLIKNKHFGNLISIIGTYYGGVKHNGIHLIDTLHYLLDENFIIDEVFDKVEKSKTKDPTLEFRLKAKKNQCPVFIFGVDEKYYQLFEIELRFTNGRIKIEDFGNSLRFEKRIINNIGENVLVPFDNLLNTKRSPLINALDIISDYLQNSNDLSRYNIKSNLKTMNLIWEIENEYKTKFKSF